MLLDKLFRDHDTLVGGRKGRWIVVIVTLALGGFLVVAPAGQDERLNHIAGIGLLALGALTFLYNLICEYLLAWEGRDTPEEWDRQEQERRMREGVEQAAKMQAIYAALNTGGTPERSWSQ
jgi:drug/metabolite transporter (DMT)-like permease